MQPPGPDLLVCGTNDETFDQQALTKVRRATGAAALVFEGANHSLEFPGDTFRSLQALEEVIQVMAEFFNQHGL